MHPNTTMNSGATGVKDARPARPMTERAAITHCEHVSVMGRCGHSVTFYTPRGVSATTMITTWLDGVAQGKCKKCWHERKGETP